VGVEDELEAGPEEHAGGIDVGFESGDLAALEGEGEMLRQTDEEQNAEGVVGVGDEGFGKGGAEREVGFEDGGELAGDLLVGCNGGEESSEEGVFEGGIVDESDVKR